MIDEQIHKLAIYLTGSEYIDGEFKLKIKDFEVYNTTSKTINLLDNKHKIRKNKSDLNKVQTDYKNNSFLVINFYAYCYTSQIENVTKYLSTAVKGQFKLNEDIYKSAKKAIKAPIKIIHVV